MLLWFDGLCTILHCTARHGTVYLYFIQFVHMLCTHTKRMFGNSIYNIIICIICTYICQSVCLTLGSMLLSSRYILFYSSPVLFYLVLICLLQLSFCVSKVVRSKAALSGWAMTACVCVSICASYKRTSVSACLGLHSADCPFHSLTAACWGSQHSQQQQ